MPKMARYALAPDGRIVNRDTGRVINGNFTTRTYSNGRVGVYDASGKLRGYVGKPTQAVQKRINRNARRREREAERRAVSSATNEGFPLESARDDFFNTVSEGRAWRQRFASGAPEYMPTPVQNRYNFADILQKAIDKGILTEEQAIERFQRYTEAQSNVERNAEWDDLKKHFKDMGYNYENGRFEAMIQGQVVKQYRLA